MKDWTILACFVFALQWFVRTLMHDAIMAGFRCGVIARMYEVAVLRCVISAHQVLIYFSCVLFRKNTLE